MGGGQVVDSRGAAWGGQHAATSLQAVSQQTRSWLRDLSGVLPAHSVLMPPKWVIKEAEVASPQDEKLILRMSRQGMSVEAISKVLQIKGDTVVQILQQGASVVQILQQGASAKDSIWNTSATDEKNLMSEVKDLLRYPEELCCPISRELMEDPVIAEDGRTYERSLIKRSLEVKQESPLTKQPIQSLALYPNQDKKSAVVEYKEAVVQKVISMKHKLLSSASNDEALKLLDKAELFVRPLLPDTSARRKLVVLLLVRVKLLGSSRDAVIFETAVLLFEIEGANHVRGFLSEIQEHEVRCLLEKLEDDMVTRLRDTNVNLYEHKDAIDLELARRLARRARYVGNDAPLEELWVLMLQHAYEEPWAKAAAVLLVSCIQRLDVNLQMVGDQLLNYGYRYLYSRDVAESTAKDFFKHDMCIPAASTWPPKECASIVMELAMRASDDNLRRILLLEEAYKMNPANRHLRADILKHLHQLLLACSEATVVCERLFLKLLCVDKQEIPENLIPKLTLSNDQLQELSADELLFLGEQIGMKRQADGSRLVVKAAELFSTMGSEERSQEAFLRAFSLDPHNAYASDGLIQLVVAMKGKNKTLEEMKQKNKTLEEKCALLEEKSCQMSFTWDLSDCDFTAFKAGEKHTSNPLPLSQLGINVWLTLYPFGETGALASLAGKASLHLDLETGAGGNKCSVRGLIRGGNQTQIAFVLGGQGLNTWVRRNFMDTSDILLKKSAWITIDIAFIQLPTLPLGHAQQR